MNRSRVFAHGLNGLSSLRLGIAVLSIATAIAACPGSAVAEHQPSHDKSRPRALPKNVSESNIEYYDLHGKTFAELWSDISANGPVGGDGKRWHANTFWNVYWNFDFDVDGAGCKAKNVSVRHTVKIIMPRWVERRDASPQRQRDWQVYWDSLLAHEKVHASFGARAAEQIRKALVKLKAKETCADFESEARGVADSFIEAGKKSDVAFDEKTDHGAKEDVTWPQD